MSISQSRFVGKKELWKLLQPRKSSLWGDLEGLHIKQAIQGLFTAGTSALRLRSGLLGTKEKVGGKRGLKASVRVLTNRCG